MVLYIPPLIESDLRRKIQVLESYELIRWAEKIEIR